MRVANPTFKYEVGAEILGRVVVEQLELVHIRGANKYLLRCLTCDSETTLTEEALRKVERLGKPTFCRVCRRKNAKPPRTLAEKKPQRLSDECLISLWFISSPVLPISKSLEGFIWGKQ